ncbi:helix-turn-helix domain-containing protein [Endozoicomonas sp. ALB032]|uniref:helix-turn-helix domain-containing protein n=1 Tax=Endozoicomonas sp. ALB032 TaxID=3403082 RepID=UPI003BB55328
MSTDEQNSQEDQEEASAVAPGQLLSAGRQKAGLSIGETADLLKLPESYILALESNEFETLPGLVFARGYVRRYARALGLDGDELVDHFDRFTGHSGAETPHLKAGAPLTTWRPMSSFFAWGASLLTVILVGAGSYYGWNLDKRSASQSEVIFRQQPSVVIESSEDVSEAEKVMPVQVDFDDSEMEVTEPENESENDDIPAVGQDSEEPLGQTERVLPEVGSSLSDVDGSLSGAEGSLSDNGSPVRLAIDFVEDCWIEVKDMSGRALYTDVQRAGSNLELEVPSSVQVRFGNVKGVADLKFDGKKVAVKTSGSGRRVASLLLKAG